MKISKETETILFNAWQYCDDKDKSTEFMLTYMADVSGLDYDEVVDWVTNPSTEGKRTAFLQKQSAESKRNIPKTKRGKYICDGCGKEFQGTQYNVYDENFNIIKGVVNCADCNDKS